MQMWNSERNPSPKGIGFYNQSKKYWWRCTCGNEWESFVASMTRRKHIGCKECIKKKCGFIDFTGQTIGEWKVIEKSKTPSKWGSLWLAECLGCSGVFEVRGDNLRSGMTNRCATCHAEKTRNKYPIASEHWRKIKNGAILRSLDFSITMKYAHSLYINQNGKCVFTGLPIVLCSGNKEYRENGIGKNDYASLDRIDNNLGYVPGNVQWTRKDINILRGSFSVTDFIKLSKLVSDYFY